METKDTVETHDPQAAEKKAPGREKQPHDSKRLRVMAKGVEHAIEVQSGTLTTDVLKQVGAEGQKLSKAEGFGGIGFKLDAKVFEQVNDQDTLYVT